MSGMSRFEGLAGRIEVSHSIHLQLVSALVLACTPRGGDEMEPKRELEPAPTLAIDPVLPTREVLPSPSPSPVPGFVLYTQDRSILIPHDGSAPVIGEGLWIQDDRSEPAPITHTLVLSAARAEALDLPGRACFALEHACDYGSFESRSFDPQTGSIVESPDPSCTSVRQYEALGWPATERDGEHFEPCAELEQQDIASLTAGQLNLHGWDWNGACFHGLNIYDATSISHDLIVDPPELDDVGMRSLGCDTEFGMPEVVPAWPLPERELVECEDHYESEVFLLRRAELWSIRDNISGAGGWRSYAKRPVRPTSCPSINDPCGDPEPFRKRAKLHRRQREFWIATDGSAALSAEHSKYSLWRTESEAPVEFELAGVDASTNVIGVRVHADLRRLRALIEQHPGIGIDRADRAPKTMDAEACLELAGDECDPDVGARTWGNECVTWIGREQWSWAERSCACGLRATDEPAARGALLYNLGVIAEAQGAREQALMQYRESLRLRPNNVPVQQRLAKLEAVVAADEGR